MNIKLGDSVRDRITGFEGVITGLVEYSTGCNQALVVPKIDKDGKLRYSHWFDIQRLEVDGSTERVVLDNTATPGCDMEPPKR